MATTNVVTADNAAVKAKISEVTTAVSSSVSELGAIFIGLCERFTGKDSQSGDNFQHLLNGLEGSKGAKRFQAAIIARLNDFSEKTISVEYNEDKKTYQVSTLKGDDKKSLFKKDKFIAAVNAAKSADFALSAPAKEQGEPKAKRFSAKTAEKKARESLLNLATGLLVSEGLTPEKLAIKLEAMIKEVLLDAKPAIEAEQEAPKNQAA